MNDNEIAVEGIAPFEAKPAKTGLHLPFGSQTNHIDACLGVFCPGVPRFIGNTGNSVVVEYIWLRMDGAFGTVKVNGSLRARGWSPPTTW